MIPILLKRFVRELEEFPFAIQRKFYKQLEFLLENPQHPSLDLKKYDESNGIWQIRVDRHIRSYFVIREDRYIFLEIRKHSK